MREGFEMDEIVNRVGLDDELIGGLQPNGGPEVAEAEGDGAAVVNVAGVAQQPHPGIRPVLDYRRRRRRTQRRRIGNGGFGTLHSEFALLKAKASCYMLDSPSQSSRSSRSPSTVV